MTRTEPIDLRDLATMTDTEYRALLASVPDAAHRNLRRARASAQDSRGPVFDPGTRDHSTHTAYMDADAFL